MIIALFVLLFVYVASCVCLYGVASLKAMNGAATVAKSEIYYWMFSQHFYLIYCFPWFLLWALYRSTQMRRV